MSHPAEQINQINWDIAHNNHDGAIASLTGTLKTLKLFLSGGCHAKIAMPIGSHRDRCGEEIDQSEKCASNTPSSPTDCDYDFFSLPDIPSFLKICESTNSIGSGTDTNSKPPVELIVFREPITVLSHKALDNQLCQELTYVCLYNLALSYHLKSLEIDPRSGLRKACLQKALSLYELSQMLQMEKSISIRVNNALHSMTLVNNLRHIHYELGHTEKVDLCSQHLLSTLMYLVYSGEVSVLGGSIDAFYDALLPLLSKSSTASAA